ncbi:MAG: T9SS type A sorting domain-containing protein [Saprospiraceae bacterium]
MRKLLFTHFLMLVITSLFATQYTSVKNGPWNDPTTWSPAGIPNISSSAAWPGDNVTIKHQVTFTGNLTTAKKSTVFVEAGGSFTVTGTLDIANTSTSSFTVASGANLTTGILTVSSCCSDVMLGGTIQTNDFHFTASQQLTITGDMTVNGDFDTQGGSSILFNSSTFSVLGETQSKGSVRFYVDGQSYLDLGDLKLTGDADIIGINQGGVISYSSIFMHSGSNIITCVNGNCNYDGSMNTSMIPSPLDLVTGAQFLPVVLNYYRATANHQGVSLQWATAQESGNDFFLLEYSTDGKQFSSLATVKGAGNSNVPTAYEWAHSTPAAGANYYKLTQYDWDGTVTFLGLQVINTQSSSFTVEGISPNPSFAGQQVRLLMPQDTYPINVHLVNGSGQQWLLPLLSDGFLTLPAHLPSGMYYVRCVLPDEVQTVPLLINRQ